MYFIVQYFFVLQVQSAKKKKVEFLDTSRLQNLSIIYRAARTVMTKKQLDQLGVCQAILKMDTDTLDNDFIQVGSVLFLV